MKLEKITFDNKCDLYLTKNALSHISCLTSTGKTFIISVSGGGCAGFKYSFGVTDNKDKNIHINNEYNIGAYEHSLFFLKDSIIDYKKEIIGSRFDIQNPNAISACSCGASFEI